MRGLVSIQSCFPWCSFKWKSSHGFIHPILTSLMVGRPMNNVRGTSGPLFFSLKARFGFAAPLPVYIPAFQSAPPPPLPPLPTLPPARTISPGPCPRPQQQGQHQQKGGGGWFGNLASWGLQLFQARPAAAAAAPKGKFDAQGGGGSAMALFSKGGVSRTNTVSGHVSPHRPKPSRSWRQPPLPSKPRPRPPSP